MRPEFQASKYNVSLGREAKGGLGLDVCLHGFIAVAQLKPVNLDCSLCALGFPSPRLHRRGPIEADGSSAMVRSVIRYLHGFIAVAQMWSRAYQPQSRSFQNSRERVKP